MMGNKMERIIKKYTDTRTHKYIYIYTRFLENNNTKPGEEEDEVQRAEK